MIEEPHWELVRNDRTCPGVVRRQNIVCAARVDQATQPRGYLAKGIIPRNLLERVGPLRTSSPQGPQQPRRRIAPDTVIGERAFAAERTPVLRMLRIACDSVDLAVVQDDADAATVVAVAGASGADHCFGHSDLLRLTNLCTRIIQEALAIEGPIWTARLGPMDSSALSP